MSAIGVTNFEGPREKLASQGSAELSDGELLAILLGTGTAQRPAPVLAEQLLCRLGGLRGLVHAGVDQLAGLSGIGMGKASRIAAALELGRRANALPLSRGTRLSSSEDVYRAFGPLLAHAQHEELWAIALDARQRVISRWLLARGGLSACPVRPADVFRPLVKAAASATILVHNHPSGAPEPSADDLALTEHLAHAGQLLGIALLDHVIVAAEGYFSCLDAGLYERKPGAS
jgi:DNA repair protein RadC